MNKRFYQLSVTITIGLMLVFLLEFGATLFIKLIPTLSGVINERSVLHLRTDGRINAPAYKDKAHARQLFKDRKKVRFAEYHPYCVWKSEAVHSQTLNISAEGLRRTCNTKTQRKPGDSHEPRRIFFFGGGHTLGIGADDCHSIPSLVSQELNQLSGVVQYEAFNFGTGGYNSTQSLIRLMLELQKQNIPDMVVFLDGQNEINAGVYDPGVPGNHLFYQSIAGRHNHSGPLMWWYGSNLFKTTRIIYKRLFWRNTPMPTNVLNGRIERSLSIYRENLRMLDALSRRYNFEYHAFWQPLLATTDKKKTDYEKMRYRNLGGLVSMHQLALKKLAAENLASLNFHNLSDVFDGHAEDIFIDGDHLARKGNGIIAARMTDVLLDRIGDTIKRHSTN